MMSTNVVGLDLGTHTVKVCELVTTFKKFELVGFGMETVEHEGERASLADIAAAARRLLEQRGDLLDPIYCSLPADYVSTLTLEFPFASPKKIEQTLPFQLEEALPVDLDQIVWDWQIVESRPDGATTVLVAYVKRTHFETFIETLQAAGVDPKVVGIGALSYFNLFDYVIGDSTGAAAVLDLGHVHAELAVFDAGRPVVVRHIRGGGLDVTRMLANAFQVSLEQAERGKLAEGFVALPRTVTEPGFVVDTGQTSRSDLVSQACHLALQPIVREVKRSLVAHAEATGRGIDRLYITGGTSQLRGLEAYLGLLLGIEIVQLDPLNVPFSRLVEGGERLRPYAGKALAAPLRAFNARHQSHINLRKGDFAYTGDFGFMRGRLITLGAAAVLIVILAAMVAVSKKRVLEAENAALTAQVKAISKVVLGEETDDADRVFNTMMAAEGSAAKLIPQVTAFQLLAEVSGRIDNDLIIDVDQFDIDLDRKKLEIRGRTESGGDVERLVEVLEGHPCFKNKVSKDKVEKSMEEKTKFRLTASSGCS
jgi:general secretion pathway protein L